MKTEQVELHFLRIVIWRKKISLVDHIIPDGTKNALKRANGF
ncbi:MAG: hypothetical protein ABL895_10425 [Cyclobacteriaceae bacterium]